MTSDVRPLRVVRKTGGEKFHDGERGLETDLLTFWQWSTSDLVSNATRGILAEYIVVLALGLAKEGVRREWDAYDLELLDGTKVEVKSAAYVQSWHQERLSRIEFGVAKRRAWSAETNTLSDEVRRHADVYVFALLSHPDRTTIDPLDVGQWEFFVVPTSALDERQRSQQSITLASLRGLAGDPIRYDGLRHAVAMAASEKVPVSRE
jgi:hypothetical protein